MSVLESIGETRLLPLLHLVPDGRLQPGGSVVEYTGGSTGVSVVVVLGHPEVLPSVRFRAVVRFRDRQRV